MHNLVSVQLQNFVTHREEQEDSHPKAADSGAYTGKHIFTLQQHDGMLFIFQYLQKLPINHCNSLVQKNKMSMKLST